ncbi:MAG: hypothetical protein RIE56_14705 [Amphiplicatus sp.]
MKASVMEGVLSKRAWGGARNVPGSLYLGFASKLRNDALQCGLYGVHPFKNKA